MTDRPDESALGALWDDEDALPIELVGGQTRRFTLSKDSSQRLDKFLQNRVKGFSRHQIQKLIELGGIVLNEQVDKKPKPSSKLRQGDVIDIRLPPRPSMNLEPEPIPLDILHEEEGFLVINKQANLIVHPARGRQTGTLLNALTHHFQKTGQAQGASHADQTLSDLGRDDARPGVIHRLDMNTTGVIVVGKQVQTHWKIAKQFEDRTNLKAYLALVHGCPPEPGGAIDQPLGKHLTIREAQCVRHDDQGKESLTLYRVRERYRGYSLVECELKSGRTHQIRVHMSYIGCPLVGDIPYGGLPVGLPEIEDPPHPPAARPYLNYARAKEEGLKMEAAAVRRADAGEFIMATPALHAALLRINHPDTDKLMTFTAPVHSLMRDLITRLRQHPDDGPTVTDGTHVDLALALGKD